MAIYYAYNYMDLLSTASEVDIFSILIPANGLMEREELSSVNKLGQNLHIQRFCHYDIGKYKYNDLNRTWR